MAASTVQVSNAANELIESVQQAIALASSAAGQDHQGQQGHGGNDMHVNNRARNRSNSNTYERRRCLRRIGRSVTSFQNLMEAHSDSSDENDETNCTHAHAHAPLTLNLNEPTLSALMDILTEIPRLEIASSDTLDDLYLEIATDACSLIQQYAVMPLHPNHVDRLLDRMATLALGGKVHLGIMQILNSSLLESTRHDHARCSLQHVNVDANSVEGNGVETDHDVPDQCQDQDQYQYQYQGGNHEEQLEGNGNNQNQNVGNCNNDEGNQNNHNIRDTILLSAGETLRLMQILIPLSLQHLSHKWIFMERQGLRHPDADTNTNTNTNTDTESNDAWDEQQGGLQLRVLLTHLVRHFILEVQKVSISMKQEADADCHPEEGMGMGLELGCRLKLEDVLFQLFQKQLVEANGCGQQLQGQGQGEECEYHPDHADVIDMVEDFTDLITSFLIENIEYANDAVENSDYTLEKYSRASANSNTNTNININIHTNCNERGRNPKIIYRHVKDVIRLSSMAIGMMEMFHGGLGLDWDAYKSHANSLYRIFCRFVALYCIETFLWDVEAATAIIASADGVLIRFRTLLVSFSTGTGAGTRTSSSITNEEEATCEYLESGSGSVAGSTGSKRRRLKGSGRQEKASTSKSTCTPLGKDEMVTLLRTFGSSVPGFGESAMPLLQHEMNVAKSFIRDSFLGLHVPSKNNSVSMNTNDQSLLPAHEISTLVQACALSTLMIPRGMDQSYGTNENVDVCNDEALFSTLVAPLVDFEHVSNEKKDDEALPCMIDAMNPWNFLIARTLSHKVPFGVHEQGERNESSPPLHNITTSSTSSVSDLRSSNTASTTRYQYDGHAQNSVKHEQNILLFSRSVQGHINTL